jgi:hypothetical protein
MAMTGPGVVGTADRPGLAPTTLVAARSPAALYHLFRSATTRHADENGATHDGSPGGRLAPDL